MAGWLETWTTAPYIVHVWWVSRRLRTAANYPARCPTAITSRGRTTFDTTTHCEDRVVRARHGTLPATASSAAQRTLGIQRLATVHRPPSQRPFSRTRPLHGARTPASPAAVPAACGCICRLLELCTAQRTLQHAPIWPNHQPRTPGRLRAAIPPSRTRACDTIDCLAGRTAQGEATPTRPPPNGFRSELCASAATLSAPCDHDPNGRRAPARCQMGPSCCVGPPARGSHHQTSQARACPPQRANFQRRAHLRARNRNRNRNRATQLRPHGTSCRCAAGCDLADGALRALNLARNQFRELSAQSLDRQSSGCIPALSCTLAALAATAPRRSLSAVLTPAARPLSSSLSSITRAHPVRVH
ncbi:hypothetical protein BDV95DRAFT_193398 [Massariosphaeria phaeospora]|uniref:Uncharacterized protein n=1 Tax=Massariosphaeria phaeospora TaxID=100035 RepID=A0A7C8M418_9PLEO|nr:hypothetical protein BDV95DRAFT_193398 [Massariosphaeria phaeospora]